MLALRNHRLRPMRLVIMVAVIYAFCWVKSWPKQYDDDELPLAQHQVKSIPHLVESDKLTVSIISTATDVYAKVPPILLSTAEKYHGELLLFADLQLEIGKWPVFDLLLRYSQNFVMAAQELGRYRAQVDYVRKSMPIQKLKKQDEQEEKAIQIMMNKYKILQAMSAAWEFRPYRSWYVFVGDETWINRANLLAWLGQYDPDSKHVFGNPPHPGIPDPFAAGGDAIILSGQVMQELFSRERKEYKDIIPMWQNRIVEHSSAFDLVVKVMQAELKLELEGAWPFVSGFNPSTVPFSRDIWCKPVAMMHHVTPEIATDLWKLEQEAETRHPGNIPLLFADLWPTLMSPEMLGSARKDWDNLSSESSNSRWNMLFEGDKAKSGEESPEACQAACNQRELCTQWSYSSIVQPNWNTNPHTKCHLSSSIRLGSYKAPHELDTKGLDTKLTWTSGWNIANFTSWAKQQRCGPQ